MSSYGKGFVVHWLSEVQDSQPNPLAQELETDCGINQALQFGRETSVRNLSKILLSCVYNNNDIYVHLPETHFGQQICLLCDLLELLEFARSTVANMADSKLDSLDLICDRLLRAAGIAKKYIDVTLVTTWSCTQEDTLSICHT